MAGFIQNWFHLKLVSFKTGVFQNWRHSSLQAPGGNHDQSCTVVLTSSLSNRHISDYPDFAILSARTISCASLPPIIPVRSVLMQHPEPFPHQLPQPIRFHACREFRESILFRPGPAPAQYCHARRHHWQAALQESQDFGRGAAPHRVACSK